MEIIQHRADYYFLKIEEDYVKICKGNHCKAAILALLERWMGSKQKEDSTDDDLFVYMSYPQFVKQMYRLFGRSSIIKSLAELECEGMIKKRPYHGAFQDTFAYRLNREMIQGRINNLPKQ